MTEPPSSGAQTRLHIDLAIGILLAAGVLALLVTLINTGAAIESFSLLAMGWFVGVILPPSVAVIYVSKRHPNVSRNFLWIYALLTLFMLGTAGVVSGMFSMR